MSPLSFVTPDEASDTSRQKCEDQSGRPSWKFALLWWRHRVPRNAGWKHCGASSPDYSCRRPCPKPAEDPDHPPQPPTTFPNVCGGFSVASGQISSLMHTQRGPSIRKAVP
eukprot:8663895-Prorocentrum_lima.AAC.1